jgi:hypothetical protein
LNNAFLAFSKDPKQIETPGININSASSSLFVSGSSSSPFFVSFSLFSYTFSSLLFLISSSLFFLSPASFNF